MIYREYKRSQRNTSNFGMAFILLLITSLIAIGASADWLNLYLRIVMGILTLVFLGRLFRIMNVLIKNEKVTLLIDDEGISYGGYQIPWSDISQVYARGGVLLNFKRGYQVGYLSKGAIQAFKELTIDGHFQKNEINGLFRSLDMELGSRGHDVVFNYLD